MEVISISTKTATSLDSVNPPRLWRREHGRRIKITSWESLTSSSPWRRLTGMNLDGLGALLPPIPGHLSTHMPHLMHKGVLQPKLYMGCHQDKSCRVSTSVEVILSAVKITIFIYYFQLSTLSLLPDDSISFMEQMRDCN